MDKTTSKPELRVVIADDHPIFRRGLRAVLETDQRLQVVAEAEDGLAALACVKEHRPDVAILDVDMPGTDGMAVARAIGEQRLPTAIVFLTMHKDELLFNAALDVGAKGYVLKDSALTEIAGCVRAVASGRSFISPELSGYLLGRRERSDTLTQERPGLAALTPAKRRILSLIAQAKTNKQIAEELFISARTVEHHREHICEKLDVRGSHALMSFAIAHKSELGD
jgi:DNA-binding NarL/FixJ family response regulator